jgi:hypothetical protein
MSWEATGFIKAIFLMKLNRGFLLFSLSGLLFLYRCGFGDALDNWHWLNPLPTGNSLYGITYAASHFVAVGNCGSALSSTNGVNWTTSLSVTTNNLNAITYGDGQFVAIGNNGVVQTSPDGTNWTARSSGTSATLDAIAYGSGIFVAVGAEGTIITSTNAVNWTPVASGVTSRLEGVSWGNGEFIAICPENEILRSANGFAWTNQTLTYVDQTYGSLNTPFDTVGFANGSFIAVASIFFEPSPYYHVAQNVFFTSTDGISWTTNFATPNSTCHFVVYGNGMYFADGSPPQDSTDGQNWTGASVSGYSSGNACAYGNGVFVMVGGGGLILTSSDASVWTSRNSGSQSILTSMAYGNGRTVAIGSSYVLPPAYNKPSGAVILLSTNGGPFQTQMTPGQPLSDVIFSSGVFTAAGQGGIILQSTNGASWTQRNSGTTYALNGIAAGGGSLVAVGDNGAIQTSPSGLAWTGRYSGTTEPLCAITYANGLFVAVGDEGTILTSPDSISWTAQFSGELSDLLSIAYGSDGFIAVGANGVIVTSPDGVNWTTQESGTTNQLFGISYGNGYYVVVGTPFTSLFNGYPAANITLSSLDGVVWTKRTPPVSEYDLLGTAFINNCFDLMGSGGTILKSDDTTTMSFGLQIQPRPNGVGLVITAPMGSNFRLQGSTNISVSGWSDLASFTNAPAITHWFDMTTNSVQFYRVVSP